MIKNVIFFLCNKNKLLWGNLNLDNEISILIKIYLFIWIKINQHRDETN
jgi:hypothetical protein